jgi:DNA-binding LacI/PurR family transcriptional regulator
MQAKNEVTIYDIAAVLGISSSTVSRALSGVPLVHKETRKRILATARQMGYRQNVFASKLRSQHTGILGAVVHRLDTAIASCFISAAECVARRNGYSLIVTQTREDEETYSSAIEHLSHHRVDGMLICNTENKTFDLPILHHGSPTVIIEMVTLPNGANETVAMAYKFSKYLIGKGCRNIVLASDLTNAIDIEEVSLGCQTAIAENENHDCRLTMQSKNELLADVTVAPGNPDGIIYIGAVLAMLSIPHDKLNRPVYRIGISRDVPDICPDKYASLGDFAAEILLSLMKNKTISSAE